VSNRRYYGRRDAGLCPQCATPVTDGVYCVEHRERHRRRVAADRHADRAGYNQYMRVWKAVAKAERQPHENPSK